MGRKHWAGIALALVAIALSLWAGLSTAKAAPQAAKLDSVTLQLKWVTQSQFAGYYVAQAKGYYKDAGLDVTIKPGAPISRPSR